MPLDRRLCFLLKPGPPGQREEVVEPLTVRDINLRTYASAEWTIYGATERAVRDTLQDAERDRGRVELYAQHPPRFVVAERIEGEPAPHRIWDYGAPRSAPRRPRRRR